MSHPTDLEILQHAANLLVGNGFYSLPEARELLSAPDNHCQKICSDGSTRRFWRLPAKAGRPGCVIAAPGGASGVELAESRSAWCIGNHLRGKGVVVPELYGWHEATGILVFEDLGDVRLHDLVCKPAKPGQHDMELADWYRSVLDQLAIMQFAGAEGFDPTWCWDTPRYDVDLMLERESGYFLRAFWQGLLGRQVPAGVAEEFADLAAMAGRAPVGYFLHRDFQSRNIMVHNGSVRFIDYQGGRLGPLGYDVASLLIDPYVALIPQLQEELAAYYGSVVAALKPGRDKEFGHSFPYLAVQRNLQIVGAFAFLSKVRGKPFFVDFIHPALVSLRDRLADGCFAEYRRVRQMVDQGLAALGST